jgi:hypothetical protein
LGVAADTIAGEFFVRAGDGRRDPEGAATPVADLGVHLLDLYEAVGEGPT